MISRDRSSKLFSAHSPTHCAKSRGNQLELLRLSTVTRIRSMSAAMCKLNAEMRAECLSHDT